MIRPLDSGWALDKSNIILDTLITSARHDVSVILLEVTLFNKTLSPSDICLLGVRCPIQPGQTVVYTMSLPMPPTDLPQSVGISKNQKYINAVLKGSAYGAYLLIIRI